MPRFDAETLRRLRAAREVSIRTEKHPNSAVVIWVVVADDQVFVRSWRGTKGRWYRDLAAGGPATHARACRGSDAHPGGSNQRAAASALSSGTVLNAMAASGAALCTAFTTTSNSARP